MSKSKSGKKVSPSKAKATDTKSEADPKGAVNKKADPSKSNKAIVYIAWKSKGITDRAELLKLVEGRVKERTLKSWLSAWKRGDKKVLPAIAKVKSN